MHATRDLNLFAMPVLVVMTALFWLQGPGSMLRPAPTTALLLGVILLFLLAAQLGAIAIKPYL